MSQAQKFKNPFTPKQPGEVARLKVVQGPEKGCIFIVTEAQAVFGRGEEADVIILDRKASRRHGLLQWNGQAWEVSDLGSSNGILVNGLQQKKSLIASGNTVTFGETTFEVMFPEVGTKVLMTTAKPMEMIFAERQALETQKKRVQSLGDRSESAKVAQGVMAGLGGLFTDRKTLIYAVVGAAAFYMLTEKEAPVVRPKTEAQNSEIKRQGEASKEARNLAAFLPKAGQTEVDETGRATDALFWAGYREYREKNYLRARIQFDTVLQIQPSHSMAIRYRDESNRAIKEDATRLLEQGLREKKIGRYKKAKMQFEAALRVVSPDQGASEEFTRKAIELKTHVDCMNQLLEARAKGKDLAEVLKKCDEELGKVKESLNAGGTS